MQTFSSAKCQIMKKEQYLLLICFLAWVPNAFWLSTSTQLGEVLSLIFLDKASKEYYFKEGYVQWSVKCNWNGTQTVRDMNKMGYKFSDPIEQGNSFDWISFYWRCEFENWIQIVPICAFIVFYSLKDSFICCHFLLSYWGYAAITLTL